MQHILIVFVKLWLFGDNIPQPNTNDTKSMEVYRMEQPKPSLESLRRAAVERMILNHYNDTLLQKGMITEREHHLMQVQIQSRKAAPER